MAEGSESMIKAEKGHQLYCKHWNKDKPSTDSNQKGIIFVVHGFAEHCLYYTELAEHLIGQGFYVFSHDHVGHGQSEGTRVHVEDFQEYVSDIFTHIDKVKEDFPADTPVFLIGHSMGGGVALMAADTRPNYFRGVVLLSPLITLDPKAASPWRIFMGKIVARVLPQMHIAKLDPTGVSRDTEHVKRYENDPLVYHSGVKSRWGLAMINALQQVIAKLEKVEVPFIVLHGTADALCDVNGSQELYDKAASTDKQIKLFPDAFHQLHNDLPEVKKEVFDVIAEWLNKRA